MSHVPSSLLRSTNRPAINWGKFVCVLLMALIIYNPFVVLIHSSTGLSVHHLSRHRATVGAGELQHFSPESKKAAVEVAPECIATVVIVPVEITYPITPDVQPSHALLQDFSSHLWFRPPPTV